MIRQRLRPHRVHLKHGRLDAGGLHGGSLLQNKRSDSQRDNEHENRRTNVDIALHTSFLRPRDFWHRAVALCFVPDFRPKVWQLGPSLSHHVHHFLLINHASSRQDVEEIIHPHLSHAIRTTHFLVVLGLHPFQLNRVQFFFQRGISTAFGGFLLSLDGHSEASSNTQNHHPCVFHTKIPP